MEPQTPNQGNPHENESGGVGGNPVPNGNPKTLTVLAA